MFRALLIASLAALVLGCSDAVPGTPPAGGGSGGSGGGAGGGGAGGSGATGGAPDFTGATGVQLYSPDDTSGSFAGSVALDDNTLVVGAQHALAVADQVGAAHVFTLEGDVWGVEARLAAQAGEEGDLFGCAVAISGDVAVVGANGHSTPVELTGAAFALSRNGQSWVSQKKVQQPNPVSWARFGSSVAVRGSTALVGAPFSVGTAGNAYLFEQSGQEWPLATELVADDPTDRFGYAVALDGDTALVGSPGAGGAAYVFVRTGQEWAQQAKLVPGSGGSSLFGASVSLSGNTAVVGTEADNSPGAAYVFVREGTTWSQQAELSADAPAAGDGFGRSVAVHGHALLVGTPHDSELGDEAGAAYVFARAGSTWSRQTKLLRPGGGEQEEFGISVALDGELAVVGTAGLLHASNPTSATVFQAQ